MYNSSTDTDNVCLANKELQDLEDEYGPTQEFHANRISLLRVLNNERALTKHLPPEIISLIFQHTRVQTPVTKQLNCTLTLGHISFHWRQIAWSTPQLWTRMLANVDPHSVNSTCQLLQLHLHNVQGLPFSLQMEFAYVTLEQIRVLVKLLCDEDNSRKIHSLFLARPPPVLADCLSGGKFPRLESLNLLDCWKEGHMTFPRIDLPHLRRLHLRGTTPSAVELSWSTVTLLVLDGIPIDISTNIFIQCPNVVEVHIGEPATPSASGSGLRWAESTDTFTFHHLTKLSWYYDTDPIHLSVFQRISTPSLRGLNWSGSADTPLESLVPILTDFASVSALTSLTFWYLEDNSSPHFFREIFARTKHLEALSFNYSDHNIIQDALSILDTSTEPKSQTMYLPLLNELGFSHGNMDRADQKIQWMIFRLMERQWRSGVSRFRLDIGLTVVDLEPEVKQAMCSLVGEGFELVMGTRIWN